MSAYVGVGLQRQIRTHFVNCCAYCHTSEALTVAIFEFEHIVPCSAGGKTIFKNLCLACPTCNRYKANRQNAPDPITGEIVPLFHPHLQVWKEHFVWDGNATELTGHKPFVKMNRPQLIRVRRMWVKMGEHPPDFD
jgi:HNH endonuclease